MQSIKTINVNPKTLSRLPSKNPNVMDPHKYTSLVRSIRGDGFLQPVLVVQHEGNYIIIDGEHRVKAAIELGLATIPAVVAPDRERAEVLRLALNHVRGELDISEVSRQMADMLEDGFTKEGLEMTGFQSWEVSAMLDSLTFEEDDVLQGSVVTPLQPEKPKSYNLSIKFASDSERATVREFFESHGNGDLYTGVLATIQQLSDEQKG